MLKKLLLIIFKALGLYKDDAVTPTLVIKEQTAYEIKPFMTTYEKRMYNIFLKLGSDYKIVPQINLASIIKKKNNDHYYSDLFRNIDFAIFDKEYDKLLLLIEIDDASHDTYKRKQRDQKVNAICLDAGIKILHFHTNYPNEESYVLKRILNNINTNNINDDYLTKQ